MDVQSLPHTRPMFARLYRQLLDEASALPGARRAALADQALFTSAVRQRDITVEGFAPRPGTDLNPYVLSVSPRFFDTMGIRFLAGRDFEETDLSSPAAQVAQVAIVNRSFARYYFDGASDASAVGRRFGFGGQGAPLDVTIVGIVDDAKYNDLRENAPHLVYTVLGPANFPTRGFSVSETTLSVRTDGHPALLATALRRTLATIDAGVPITGIATLEQHVDRSLGQDRLVATLSALFGALALGLTCTGIYGVLSYSVTRRTREIGVRLALGAQPAQIHWMIARRGLMVLAMGLIVGVPAAAAAAQSINALLFNVTRMDVVSFGGALLVITIATLLASHGPARAAARVDPIDAIRRV
jgi:predicted permease